MRKTAHGWKVFDERAPVLIFAYSFGPGEANALAVKGTDGMVVISPPCRCPEGVLDDVAEFAPVKALVASNAFHHLGLPRWKARFPDAEVFAPAQSIARVEKHTKIDGIRPLVVAASITGPRVELVDMPFYKTGEVLVKVSMEDGSAWYVTDVIFNMRKLPPNPIAKIVFGLSRSGPGLRFNNISPLFMMADKSAHRRWITEEFRKDPPRWLIAAHGSTIDFREEPEAARKLFPR